MPELEPEKKPSRAVLFDLDGTLLDTLDDLADAMNQVLIDLGAPTHDREAYRHFIGDGVEWLVRRALPTAQTSDEQVQRSVAEMRRHYDARWDRKTRPYPGIPELLDALAARRLPLAILSNKPHDFVVKLADRLLGRWSFARVLGARPGVPKKPDPIATRAVAAELGIPPDAWLYLGDTGTDMQTARAAGMVAVGVLWGFRDADELRADGAQRLIARPLELLDLL
jgi:phosphoglycolate phosphatase